MGFMEKGRNSAPLLTEMVSCPYRGLSRDPRAERRQSVLRRAAPPNHKHLWGPGGGVGVGGGAGGGGAGRGGGL